MTNNPRDDLIRLMSQAVGLAAELSADLLAEAADIMADIQVPVRTVQALTWRAGFNPNQPRDESGQWSETGAGGGLLSGLAAGIDTTPSDAMARLNFELAESEARQYGIPAERVDYGGAGYQFTVGDRTYTSAGNYNPATGVITVFDGGLKDEEFVQQLIAHEASHHLWETVETAYREEVKRLIADKDDVIKPAGTLRDEYRDRYPLYALIQPYRDNYEMQEKLKAKDGVTSYSRAYWEAYNNGHTVSIWLAINETLAEIASLRSKGETKGVSRLWLSYHKALREAYALVLKQQEAAKKAAAAVGQRQRAAPLADDPEYAGPGILAPFIVWLNWEHEVVDAAQADLASIWYPDSRHAYGILTPDGPQARAGFDPAQPRDEGGRWSETGASLLHAGTPIDYEAELAGEKGLPENLRDRMRIAYDVVRDMGGNPINVDYGGAGYPFELNGQTFYAAASFNQDTMVIEIYDNVLGGAEITLRATVAHEQSHYMYERVNEEMEREQWRIQALPDDAEVFEADGVTVTPEYASQFPLHALMLKYDQGQTMRQLRKEDGVTSYSREYWGELETYLAGGVSAPNISFDLAINETLAEISAMRQSGNTKAIADIWEAYYKDLLEAYAAISDMDNK